ncbi:unnamed protein product [Phaedon cochleariae]|uniref:Uncharacterized protein n=1 Tax=Phaedon cochleariae TaxID=80249 RepID=A0A9P0DHH5_PHACE|nr:unnamed protein product [Phaedon cochleariae]
MQNNYQIYKFTEDDSSAHSWSNSHTRKLFKMKVVALIFAFIAVAAAAPQLQVQPQAVRSSVGAVRDASKDAVILRYDNDNIGVDGYNYAVETSDGQARQEQGQLQNAGTDDEHLAVQGRYSYTGPDGILYEVVYVADKDGFRATGAHLPVAP